ncbi:sensor histidine kinase [Streptomyces sp. SID11385]|uniref:sensor histidine kinase n=1 Tax=Streptomyces sp. SID11385 TaxID=2706031 RepID=UPI0013C7E7AC|nr:sensor histidine kinase [Streptomyces sp. SID11385]NEA39074.1 sensor histidine kinase [Streptomyces sp. SID11385]
MLLTGLPLLAATAVAGSLLTGTARITALAGGVVALALGLALTAEVIRSQRARAAEYRAFRRHLAEVQNLVDTNDERLYYLTDVVLPRIHELACAGIMDRRMEELIREYPKWRDDFTDPELHLVSSIIGSLHEMENIRHSTVWHYINITRRLQAVAHSMSEELREMEERHGRAPEYFDDLLRVDHACSMMIRWADDLATLGGGRPSRRWPGPVSLLSTLRGAQGRILEFPRIHIMDIPDIDLKGNECEGVLQAVAELMDNGCKYSAPSSKVFVSAMRVEKGISISVEDQGGSTDMIDKIMRRFKNIYRFAKTNRDIGQYRYETGIGYFVLGRLCLSYEMNLEVRPSAYGGLRAILFVPEHLIEGINIDYPALKRKRLLAHGIGAEAVPRFDENDEPIVPLPRREHVPYSKYAGPPERNEDGEAIPPTTPPDAPVYTERTPEGLPQRRRTMPYHPGVGFAQYATEEEYLAEQASIAEQAEINRRAAAAESWNGPLGTREAPYGTDREAPYGTERREAPHEDDDWEQPEPGIAMAAFFAAAKGGGLPEGHGEAEKKPADSEYDDNEEGDEY